MEIFKIATRTLLFTIILISLSCDLRIVNTDIELAGTPCYFSDEWAHLYYRLDRRNSIGIGSGGIIYNLYWNDSLIVVMNDSVKYEIITLFDRDTIKSGVPWKCTGYISKADFDNYSIDMSKMKHIDLSDFSRWATVKKYREINTNKRTDDFKIDSIHCGQEMNKRLKQAGLDTMINPYFE